MKTRTIILLLTLVSSIQCYSQARIMEAYNAVPNNALPYQNSRQNVRTPHPGYGFSYFRWGKGTINDDVYADMGLTVKESVLSDGWPVADLERTFSSTNGSYKLCAVNIGYFDSYKMMLISINPNNGNYIDAIEVGVSMSIANADEGLHPKQWKIDQDMKVTVYQLKPISSTPIMCESAVAFPLKAQRIDKVYQIDSTGHFSLLSTKLYQPRLYIQYNFSDTNYNIWQGNEVPE